MFVKLFYKKLRSMGKRTLSVFLCMVLLLSVAPVSELLGETLGGKIGAFFESVSDSLTPKADAANVDLDSSGANECQVHDYWRHGTTSSTAYIYAVIQNPSGIVNPKVAVWSDYKGQDDLKWYDMTYEAATNRWLYKVFLVNHCSGGGNGYYDKYHVHFYNNGKGQVLSGQGFDGGLPCYFDGVAARYGYFNGTNCDVVTPSAPVTSTLIGTSLYAWINSNGTAVAPNHAAKVGPGNNKFTSRLRYNQPTISISDIVGGKRVTYTNPSQRNGNGYSAMYYSKADGTNGSTTAASVSVDITGAQDRTVYSYVKLHDNNCPYDVLNSATANASFSIMKCGTPQITTSPAVTGYNVVFNKGSATGTLYYSTDGGKTYGNTNNTSITVPLSSAATYSLKAYIGNAPGYANGDVVTQSLTISKCDAPSISTKAQNGGHTVTFSQGSTGGTLYYSTNGGSSYSITTKSSASVSLTTAGTFNLKAYVGNKSGYANSDTTTKSLTISKFSAPSITLDPELGGYYVSFQQDSPRGTMYYSTDGGSSWSNTTSEVVAVWLTTAGTYDCKAYVVNVSGYANSDTTTKSLTFSQCSAPSIESSPIVGGIDVTFSQGSTGGTLYYSTDDGSTWSNTTNSSVTVSLCSAKSYNCRAYVKKIGYESSARSLSVISVIQCAAPTITKTPIIGGYEVTFSQGSTRGTLYYSTNNGSSYTSTTNSSISVDLTSEGTWNLKSYVTKSGYANSATQSESQVISACAAPTLITSNYVGGKTVALSCTTDGATIYYTTDGSNPTTSSTKYTGGFNLSSSQTVKAIAVKSGWVNSSALSQAVTVDQVDTPVLSQSNYVGGKTVTLSCGTSGAAIYYTTDGSTPTGDSARYTSSFNLPATKTVKAIAMLTGYGNSDIMSQQVTVDPCEAPEITKSTIDGGCTVRFSQSSNGTTLYYSTDGGDTYQNTTASFAEVNLTTAGTYELMAYSTAPGYSQSSVTSETVAFNACVKPVLTTEGFIGGKKVTLATETQDAEIYYTTDGSIPTAESAKYTEPFNLTSTRTVKAIAIHPGLANSTVLSQSVTVEDAATPVITSKGYKGGKTVTIACSTEGAAIYYTTDGTAPTTDSTKYEGTFNVSSSQTVKSIAVCSGYTTSAIATENVSVLTAAAPTITTAGYFGGKTVTLSSTTTGAEIYYTTDGSDPTEESTKYTEPFNLTADSTTVKAIAVCDGFVTSTVSEETITISITAEPVIEVNNFVGGKSVSLSSSTTGAALYYTTDGTEPTTNSTKYTGAFNITSTSTVKAIAVLSGSLSSNVAEKEVVVVPCAQPEINVEKKIGGYNVSVAGGTEGCTYYISTDGGENYTIYHSPISLVELGTYNVKAYCTCAGYTQSEISEKEVTVSKCEAPVITTLPASGGYFISLDGGYEGSEYYISIDGGETFAKYTAPVKLVTAGDHNVKAYCVCPGYAKSDDAECAVHIEKVATPAIEVTATQSGKKVTVTTATEEAKLYYTTDGSTPSESSNEYTEALTFENSVNLKVIAIKKGYENSDVSSVNVSVTACTTPVITAEPSKTGYSVSLSGGTSNCEYFISLDGGNTFEKYVQTVNITKAGTYNICAYCTCDGYTQSETAQKEIEITQCTAPVITKTATADGYRIDLSGGEDGCEYYISTNGGETYTKATSTNITVAGEYDIKAYCTYEGKAQSEITNDSLTITKVATPKIEANGIAGGKNVTITCETEGATIYYTTDGTAPTNESHIYSAPINVTSDKTIRAIAYLDGCEVSDGARLSVIIEQAKTPVASIEKYVGGKKVTLASETEGATIYYTTDGTAPTTNSTVYEGEIDIKELTTIKAIAVKDGFLTSGIMTETVNVPTVVTPVITSANVTAGKAISISTSTSGAKIYYTTDGENYQEYNGPVEISKTTTISAYAELEGYLTSEVKTSTFTLVTVAEPTVTATDFIGGKTVTMETATEGATIYYTTDGTEPTADSKEYTAAFNVTEDTVVKAIAVLSGNAPSKVTTLEITVPVVETPVVNTEVADGKYVFTISDGTDGATIYYTTDGSEPTADSNVYNGPVEITEAMTVKAIAVKNGCVTSEIAEKAVTNEFTITYIVDGEEYRTETHKFGESITALAEPEKAGFTFSGWSEIPSTMPAENVEVTGTFKQNEYTITYYVDDVVYKTEKYVYGAEITPVAEPEKDGYTFSGWGEVPTTMPENDVVVKGTFAVNQYKIEYFVDGALYDSQLYNYGENVTPLEAPEKNGYTFSGWSEIPATMPANDIKVEGTFTANEFTITYYVDGEVYKTVKVPYESVITFIDEPTKDGYTFSGWSCDYITMPAQDIEVNGTFDSSKYSVSVTNNHGTVKGIPEGKVEYGTEVSLFAKADTGYTFKGWYNGDTLLSTRTTYTFNVTDDTNLIAMFEANTKRILTVNVVGGNSLKVKLGDGNLQKQPTYYKQGVSIGTKVTLDVTDSAGEFLYWIDSNDTIVSYDRTYTFVHFGETSYRAVFAQQVSESNTVTFIGAYDQILESSAYQTGEEINVPTASPKTDYNFIGWSLDGKTVIASIDELIAGINAMLAEGKDVVVRGIYTVKEVKYNVTVIGGSGSGEYNGGVGIKIVADSPEAGKKFAYWIDSNNNIVSYSEEYSFYPHSNETYTAVFVNEDEVIDALPISGFDSVKYDEETDKLTFVSTTDVPKSMSIVSVGILLTSNDTTGNNAENFVETNGNVLMGTLNITDDSKQARYSLTKKNVMPGDVWYARTYLTYYDNNGELKKLYGVIIKAVVNDDGSVSYSAI